MPQTLTETVGAARPLHARHDIWVRQAWKLGRAVRIGALVEAAVEEVRASRFGPLLGERYLKSALASASRQDRHLAKRFRHSTKVLVLADALKIVG